MNPTRPRLTIDRAREESRALDGLTSALVRLIRWYASEPPEGVLVELLRTWEDARAMRLDRKEGGRSEAAGTVLGWFQGAASRELRRGIRRAAGNPPEDQPAVAWVGGRIAIALPASAEPDPDKAFLIIEPPRSELPRAQPGDLLSFNMK